MKKILQKTAVSLIAIGFMICTLSYAAQAKDDGKELKENSWRYTDGKVQQSSVKARAADVPYAWTKVNGSYVNNLGNPIPGAVAKGIDVSYHNGTINWAAVKNSDVNYAIIRCGYGQNITSQDDKKWLENVAQCEKYGIPYGVYIYSYATSVSDAKSEADHVLRLVKGHNFSYPIYFDMEDNTQGNLSAKELGDIASAFCSKIQSAGYNVGIYANTSWFNNKLTDSRFSQWEKWVAQYNSVCKYKGQYSMWQCTSTGGVSGISGNVDLNFQIEGWNPRAIKTNVSSPQCRKTDIQLSADMIGNTNGLQYKFVWQKDNWADWGVLQNYSSSSSVKWTPTTGGNYTLYMDIMDASGKTVSITLPYEIENWEITGITPNLTSPQVKNTAIGFTVNTAGDNTGLNYKAVWEKNNWSPWGVIQNYATTPSFTWTPTEAGTYNLYVDIMTTRGRTISRVIPYTVLQKGWKVTDVNFSEPSPQQLNTAITINPILKDTLNGTVLGEDRTQGYRYKYVWEKDNWAQWGVISDFTETPNCTWQPQVDGDYNFYIDVMDPEGNAESYHSSYKITEGVWNYQGIEPDPSNTNIEKSNVKFTTKIGGNSAALQYKYVWNKNNWAQWGVIQPYNTDPNVEWRPEEAGIYTVTVDIMRSNGKTESHSKEFVIADKTWKCTGITAADASPQELGFTTSIAAQVQNPTNDLQYKYVWEKNNWAEWGVLKPFSSDATVNWTPESAGDYTLYVDVMDSDGNAESKTTKYTVDEGKWTYNQIAFNPDSSVIGENVTVQADVIGNTQGLRYKYVWEKDNWAQWGVIRNFDSDPSTNWIPSEPGIYTIYLDILSSSGKIESKTVKHTINDKQWSCTGINSSLDSPQDVGITTSLKAQITNPTDELVYKYVWEKNNWAEWGVLQPFSTESTVDWTPDSPGEYTIYVDVMDRHGNAESKTKNYSIR